MTHPEEPPGPAPAPPGSAPAPPGPAPAPPGPAPAPPGPGLAAPPATEIVEWGARPPRWGFPWVGWRGRDLPVARPLAGLGAIALFASTIGDWQLISRSFGPSSATEGRSFADDSLELRLGVETVGAFGLVWLIGAAGLAICVWLTLFGLPTIRAYARSVAVATAGVLLGLLAAAAVSVSTDLTETIDPRIEMVEHHQPGWGLYAAFASALLLGAAAWLARVPTDPALAGGYGAPNPAPAALEPAVPGGQAAPGQGAPDLAVGPAEPFARPDDAWRRR